MAMTSLVYQWGRKRAKFTCRLYSNYEAVQLFISVSDELAVDSSPKDNVLAEDDITLSRETIFCVGATMLD